MKIRLYILTAYCFVLNVTLAQDYHFSQFDANPFYFNPALTGERLGDYNGIQVNANFRDQMARYTKSPSSYRSMAVGIDEPINSKFSLGQSFFNDKSATGSFNTSGFMLSIAHKLIDQTADKEGNHNLSVGIQIGVLNKSIHPQDFTYDAQYSTNSSDGFDRSLPTGEEFARQSYYNLNVNFGIYYRGTTKNKKVSAFGGFSTYNIARPNESFLKGDGYSALPLRFNLHGGLHCKATRQLTVMPQLRYMSQAKATELNISTLLLYKIEGTPYETIYGLGIRNKDAIIFHLGLKFKGLAFRASYDIITNYAKAYRNQGLEFSLINTFKKKAKTPVKKDEVVPASDTGTVQP